MQKQNHNTLNRRQWLTLNGTTTAGFLLTQSGCEILTRDSEWNAMERPTVTFGLITDLHYADAPPAGTRHYRQSQPKLAEFITAMNTARPDFIIECGDFKDQDNPPVESQTLAYLEDIESTFVQFTGPRYHVLGNHDLDSISKSQFLQRVENTNIDPSRSYYDFTYNGLHVIVLDANYTTDALEYDHGQFDWTDANIPPKQLDWLETTLRRSNHRSVVFTHQLLDGTGPHTIKNAPDVRHILQKYGRAAAVFQGHQHAGGYSLIEGIHYVTLPAAVEGPELTSSAYALVSVPARGGITLTGYRNMDNLTLI